ncbi:MAG: zinc-binding dehydrogenase [Solirubrobacterales bacterium]|nr:zinc-binding dehydrogenase [Solirubrobacterales bacterium]
MLAIRIDDFGDPSVLKLGEVPEPAAGHGQILIGVDAAGVNFGDILVRRGEYFGRKALPVIPGWEVVGTAASDDPEGSFAAGDRVVALLDGNGYAQRVAAPVRDTVPVPDGVPDEVALAMIIQGATAWRLLEDLKPGQSVLASGAGSGVTHLVIQLARIKGAAEVAVVSSGGEKTDRALQLGAGLVVQSEGDETLKEQLASKLDGRKFDLAIDMVGGETLQAMLRQLRPGGRAVIYGVAGGEPAKVNTGALLKNGLTVSGLWLGHSEGWSLREIMAGLFELVQAGQLTPTLGPTFPLAEAAEAHRAVEARTGVGKVVLDCRDV